MLKLIRLTQSCGESDLVTRVKCTEMGSNILCLLNISNTPMNCGRCLHPCTFSITNQVERGTMYQEIYKIKYIADRDFFVFTPLFLQDEICSCDKKKKKKHSKSSLRERLKVKVALFLISFSSISIHQVNAADFHSV